MSDKKEQEKGKGFVDGIEAMRDLLAREFGSYGAGGRFSGAEIATLIRQAPGPLRDKDSTTVA